MIVKHLSNYRWPFRN